MPGPGDIRENDAETPPYLSTVYLGLAKDDQEGLAAHAWIRSGDRILTGADAHDQFKVIATFGDVE